MNHLNDLIVHNDTNWKKTADIVRGTINKSLPKQILR